jgi:CspA family cold shock protein
MIKKQKEEVEMDQTNKVKRSKVKWFNDSKGYGYLVPLESMDKLGKDIFVHYTAIKGDGFKTLAEGDNVTFELVDGPKGPLATNVQKD